MPHLTVVHHIPGRLRVRLPAGVKATGLEKKLLEHPGVKAARHSPRSRNVLVHYHPKETTSDAVINVLATLVGLETKGAEAQHDGASDPFSLAVIRTMLKLNAAVSKRTSGHVDVRTLAALAIAWVGSATDHAWTDPGTLVADSPLVCVRAVPAPSRSGGR